MEKPVELVNLKSLEKALNGLEKSLKEKRSALLHRIGNHLQNRISESFEEERSPLGGKWKPLALSTLERYCKRRYKQKHKKRFGGWGSKEGKHEVIALMENTDFDRRTYKRAIPHFNGSENLSIPDCFFTQKTI